MNAAADLSGIERTAYRDTQQDGLTELVTGVFLFINGIAMGRPAFSWMYLLAILVLGRGLKQLKARYTYPRIGYAEMQDEDPKSLKWGILSWIFVVLGGMAIALALTGNLTNNLAWRQWAPAIAGFMFMGGFLYLASKSGLARQYVYVFASPALGLLLATQTFGQTYEGLSFWAWAMAALLLSIGGFVFWRFLRDNPVIDVPGPEDASNEPVGASESDFEERTANGD